MDYWEWMTAIMVVLVLANLIRMNLWLMAIGQQLTYLYDQDIQDRQMQEDIMKQIQVRFATSPVDEVSNAEAIHEWDYGGNE
jgi:hypothetical protein